MDVRDLTGRAALVTGAGSGIGRETAIALAERGADLFLCDINEEGLKATEQKVRAFGRGVHTRRTDVASASEMEELAGAVHAEVRALDILVNNAGVGVGAEFLETTLEDWEWLMGINVMGVVHGCHYFVPKMVERGQQGHVVNIASMAGFVPTPALCAYNATKAAVVSISESLRSELKRHRIGVTAICPGLINTPMPSHIRYRGASTNPDAQAEMKRLMARRNYGPERVARGILRAIQKNRAVAPVAPEAWVGYYLKRFFPRLTLWIVRQMNDRARRRFAR